MDLPTQETLDFFNGLTVLIAAQGLFALAAIFFFLFMKGRERKWGDLGAGEKTTLVLTVFFTLAAGGVWTYATFFHRPLHMVSGSVRDIRDNDVQPSPRDTLVRESFEPVLLSQSLLTAERARVEEPAYDLHWIVTSKDEIPTVRLRLVRYFELHDPRRRALGLDPVVTGLPKFEVTIPLDTLEVSRARPLELALVPDTADPLEGPGAIRLLTATGHDRILPLTRVAGLPAREEAHKPRPGLAARLLDALFRPLRAQSLPVRGELSAHVQRLEKRLASQEPARRLAAIEGLADRGPDGLELIRTLLALEPTEGSRGERALLYHGLADALRAIEDQTGESHPRLHLDLARAFSAINDLGAAAREFDLAGTDTLPSAELYLDRAVAYQQVQRYDESVQDFGRYQEMAPASPADRAAAELQRGYSLFLAGDTDRALQAFDEAIRVQPGFAPALNGAAYLRAEADRDLERALDYAAQATQEEPDNPDFMDTRGWVLCKLGRTDEAARWLQRALEARPDDPTFERHLEEVAEGGCEGS